MVPIPKFSIVTPSFNQAHFIEETLRHLVETFFNGSVKDAVAALLDAGAANISREDLERIALLVDEARKGRT